MAQGGYVPPGLRLRATTRLIHPKKQHRTLAIFLFCAFGGSVNDRMAQFTHKITQDARHFFICVLCGPFSDRGARLAQRASCCLTRTCVLSVGGSSLGTPPPHTTREMPPKEKREEVGSRCASHTHYRLFDFPC